MSAEHRCSQHPAPALSALGMPESGSQTLIMAFHFLRWAAENCIGLTTVGTPGELHMPGDDHSCLRWQVRWAAENGIGLTTADTPGELHKLARWHPAVAVLLRIRADDPSARCCLARRAAPPP